MTTTNNASDLTSAANAGAGNSATPILDTYDAIAADGARFGSIAVANPFRRDGLPPHAKAVLGLE